MAFDPRPADKRNFKSERIDLHQDMRQQVNHPDISEPDPKDLAIQIFNIETQLKALEDLVSQYISVGEPEQAKALQYQIDLLRKEYQL